MHCHTVTTFEQCISIMIIILGWFDRVTLFNSVTGIIEMQYGEAPMRIRL